MKNIYIVSISFLITLFFIPFDVGRIIEIVFWSVLFSFALLKDVQDEVKKLKKSRVGNEIYGK